ncbi:MAG TPA: hypothetical protein VGG45_13935 [Terracidiphilus sp.]|jgi:hypothetical protein
MDEDKIEEFERDLRKALERAPAPDRLKHKVMERRRLERQSKVVGIEIRSKKRTRLVWLERIAASLVLASVAGSAVVGHYAAERRKGEEAKQKVFTALRITNHAFDVMNEQLRERDERSR